MLFDTENSDLYQSRQCSDPPNILKTIRFLFATICSGLFAATDWFNFYYIKIIIHLSLFSNEDWLSSPSPGSVPGNALPLSPSPGSQSHTYATMSNGYSSPMSTGSYDPYSPNGKLGEYKIFKFLTSFQSHIYKKWAKKIILHTFLVEVNFFIAIINNNKNITTRSSEQFSSLSWKKI